MRILRISIFITAISLVGLGNVFAQTHDISSGGLPTLTGSRGGTITGSSSTLNDLTVVINWGEVSPLNTNAIIKATVPIAIRSIGAYQIAVSVSGGTSVNPQGMQRSDVGFGLARTFTRMGANSRTCSSADTFNASITADPTVGVTTNAAGRTTYVSSLNTITGSTVILSGPDLSLVPGRRTDNGWIISVVFALTPQFYASGTTSTTVTFTIGPGPVLVC
jgi:hypothetical protein